MKKSILFVINSLGQGGAEKALVELLNVLNPEQYDLYLFLMVNRGELYLQLPSYVRVLHSKRDPRSVLSPAGQFACIRTAARASFRRLSLFRDLPYLCRNWRDLKRRKIPLNLTQLTWKVVSDGSRRLPQEFDLAVAYLEGAATYYVADHVRAKRKAAFVHVNFSKAGYTRGLNGTCYDRFDRVYTVSDNVKADFLGVHPEQEAKTRVFHNIINVPRILEKAGEPGFEDGYGGKRIVTLGRLTPEKGYELPIKALALLLKEGRDLRWYALGEGPERPKLEKLIAELGLEGRFLLMGSKENPYPYLKAADIYVHATRYEGKSVSIEEAQVLRKPIVASDIPGNREQILSGKDGLLVELAPEKLAAAIASLLDSPETCCLFEQELARKEFAYETDVREFLNMMEEPV